MGKRWKIILSVLSCIIILAGAGVGLYFGLSDKGNGGGSSSPQSSSGTSQDPVATYYTVTYANTAIPNARVEAGSLLLEPTSGTAKDKYVFLGWYKDADFSTQWDFVNDKVNANTTLYAKYERAIYGMRINTDNVETEFDKGEMTDYNGLVVEIMKSDLKYYTLPVGDYTITSNRTDVNVAGWYTITVQYRTFHSDYEIEVLPTTEKGLFCYVNDSLVYRSYVDNGAGLPEELEEPTYPQAGYEFAGWYTDKGCTTAFSASTITADTVLYSKWTKKFLITFNNVDVPGQYALAGEKYSLPNSALIAKTGYDLVGFFTNEDYTFYSVDGDGVVTGEVQEDSISVEGLAKEIHNTNNEYYVLYSRVGTNGSNLVKTPVYKKVYTGSYIKNEQSITATEAHDLYAIFEPKTFRVTYAWNNNSLDDYKYVTYNQAYGELPPLEDGTYISEGWMLNDTRITKDSIVKITSDVQLIAQVVEKEEVDRNLYVRLPYLKVNLADVNYHVYRKSYYRAPEGEGDATYVEEAFVFNNNSFAKYLLLNSTTVLDGNTFVFDSKTFTYDSTARTLTQEEALVGTGYGMFSYQSGDNKYAIDVSGTNVKIFASFDASANVVADRYMYEVSSKTIYTNYKYEVYNGYTYDYFLDEFLDDLFARYSDAACTRIYAGSKLFAKNMSEDYYEEWLELVRNKTIVGYIFEVPEGSDVRGFYDEKDAQIKYGAIINRPDNFGIGEDITLSIKTCIPVKINLSVNGGTLTPAITYVDGIVGDLFPTLPTPSKVGYAFGGWYYDTSYRVPIQEGTLVQGNNTRVYARWDKLAEITVRVYPDTAATTSIATYKFQAGSTYGANFPSALVREGYVFKGWYSDVNLTTEVTADDVVKTNVLYPKFESIYVEVTLNYVDTPIGNGHITVKYGDMYGALPTMISKEFADGGWYADVGYETKVTSATRVQNTEAHILYFRKLPYHQVVFTTSATDVVGEGYKYKKALLDTILIPKSPYTRDGYVFAGWFIDANDNGIMDGSEEIIEPRVKFTLVEDADISFHAYWVKEATLVFRKGAESATGANPLNLIIKQGESITLPQIPYDMTSSSANNWITVCPDGTVMAFTSSGAASSSGLSINDIMFKIWCYDDQDDWTLVSMNMLGEFEYNGKKFTYTDGTITCGGVWELEDGKIDIESDDMLDAIYEYFTGGVGEQIPIDFELLINNAHNQYLPYLVLYEGNIVESRTTICENEFLISATGITNETLDTNATLVSGYSNIYSIEMFETTVFLRHDTEENKLYLGVSVLSTFTDDIIGGKGEQIPTIKYTFEEGFVIDNLTQLGIDTRDEGVDGAYYYSNESEWVDFVVLDKLTLTPNWEYTININNYAPDGTLASVTAQQSGTKGSVVDLNNYKGSYNYWEIKEVFFKDEFNNITPITVNEDGIISSYSITTAGTINIVYEKVVVLSFNEGTFGTIENMVISESKVSEASNDHQGLFNNAGAYFDFDNNTYDFTNNGQTVNFTSYDEAYSTLVNLFNYVPDNSSESYGNGDLLSYSSNIFTVTRALNQYTYSVYTVFDSGEQQIFGDSNRQAYETEYINLQLLIDNILESNNQYKYNNAKCSVDGNESDIDDISNFVVTTSDTQVVLYFVTKSQYSYSIYGFNCDTQDRDATTIATGSVYENQYVDMFDTLKQWLDLTENLDKAYDYTRSISELEVQITSDGQVIELPYKAAQSCSITVYYYIDNGGSQTYTNFDQLYDGRIIDLQTTFISPIISSSSDIEFDANTTMLETSHIVQANETINLYFKSIVVPTVSYAINYSYSDGTKTGTIDSGSINSGSAINIREIIGSFLDNHNSLDYSYNSMYIDEGDMETYSLYESNRDFELTVYFVPATMYGYTVYYVIDESGSQYYTSDTIATSRYLDLQSMVDSICSNYSCTFDSTATGISNLSEYSVQNDGESITLHFSTQQGTSSYAYTIFVKHYNAGPSETGDQLASGTDSSINLTSYINICQSDVLEVVGIKVDGNPVNSNTVSITRENTIITIECCYKVILQFDSTVYGEIINKTFVENDMPSEDDFVKDYNITLNINNWSSYDASYGAYGEIDYSYNGAYYSVASNIENYAMLRQCIMSIFNNWQEDFMNSNTFTLTRIFSKLTIKSIAPDGTEFESITDIADGDDISNQGLDIYYTITPSKYTAVADNRMYWAVKTVSYQYGDNPSTTLPWGNIDSCYNTYKGGIVTITYERALNVAFDGFDEIGLTPSQTTISESTLTTLSTQVSDSSYVAGTIWNELEIWSSIDFDKYCLSIKYCNP